MWKWGVPAKEKKHINDLLAAIRSLKDRGAKGIGDHQLLPREEGGAAHGVHAPPAPDGARSVI